MSQTGLLGGELEPKSYFYSAALVLAVLFALLDNNQTDLALPLLLLLWGLQTLLPVSLLMLCQERLQQFSQTRHWSAWLKLITSGLLVSLLFTAPALCLDILAGLDPLYSDWPSWLHALALEFIAVAPVLTLGWLAVNAPWLFGWRLVKISQPSADTSTAPVLQSAQTHTAAVVPTADFLRQHSQLSALAPEAVLYMKAELHYLLVVTNTSRSLILSSLKDAIADMPPQSGFQPHRSYWVSHAAVHKLVRQGRQGELLLTDNSRIPVSRQQLATVTNLLQQ